jgi:hypothetical protein
LCHTRATKRRFEAARAPLSPSPSLPISALARSTFFPSVAARANNMYKRDHHVLRYILAVVLRHLCMYACARSADWRGGPVPASRPSSPTTCYMRPLHATLYLGAPDERARASINHLPPFHASSAHHSSTQRFLSSLYCPAPPLSHAERILPLPPPHPDVLLGQYFLRLIGGQPNWLSEIPVHALCSRQSHRKMLGIREQRRSNPITTFASDQLIR